MARKKSRMFKQISNVHLETIANDDWSSFLIYQKQQDSMASAYIDKVRISFVLGEEESETQAGLLFVASMDPALNSVDPSANDGQIISASASRGGGGVVSLPINRRITSNFESSATHPSTSGYPVYLHVRANTLGEQTKAYLVVETWGRWFKQTSL